MRDSRLQDTVDLTETACETPRMVRRAGQRTLATVLFTDIVGSTGIAEELGDRRWQELLRRHHQIVRRELKRFSGREVDTAGDGFFATFDRPADAVRCAAAVVADVRELGIEIRAGLHTGELEIDRAGARGIAVHVGARVMSTAGAGEVIVSSTTRDLVAGSGLRFDDRGKHPLKGVEGEWRLFAATAVDDEALAPPLGSEEAARRRTTIQPPSRGARSRALLGATAAVVVLAAVGTSFLLGSGDGPAEDPGPTGPTLPAEHSVIAVDAETGAIERTVPSVVNPSGGGRPRIVVAEGGVWIRSWNLVHVDQESAEVLTEYREFACCDFFASLALSVGARTLWAPAGLGISDRPGTLHRLDPASGAELRTIELRLGSPPTDVAIQSTSAWVGFADGTLQRLDANTGRLLDTFDIGSTIDAVAVGGDALWTLDQLGLVTRVDPDTGEAIARVLLPGNPRIIAADEQNLWVLDPDASTVTPIVAASNAPGTPIGPLGEQPTGMALGMDAIWISNADGSVYRIDPVLRDVTRIDVGVPTTAIAADPSTGRLWLAVGRTALPGTSDGSETG